ncbi:MAG: single-stranded DNA-binding protein [Candidatus Eisenbacteria bacterium]|uniref:Single-stranded DNA-binding protein n=1 Tax=Eiseniibacteriota bacterium TaxID=2212470 RepID=A0A849SKV5_UNCEI|nr:single-stranded DNA-binding protein [Candidatus Eisenbacteria bacterium]
MAELRLPELNRVLISGRLTRDPDRRYASDGTTVTTFDLAFHRRYRNRDGSAGEQTGFVTVVTYQRVAETVGEYLHKGSAVMIEGRLQMREWQNERGERRTRIEVRAELVHFLERRGADAGTEVVAGPGAPPKSESGEADRARGARRRNRS